MGGGLKKIMDKKKNKKKYLAGRKFIPSDPPEIFLYYDGEYTDKELKKLANKWFIPIMMISSKETPLYSKIKRERALS